MEEEDKSLQLHNNNNNNITLSKIAQYYLCIPVNLYYIVYPCKYYAVTLSKHLGTESVVIATEGLVMTTFV